MGKRFISRRDLETNAQQAVADIKDILEDFWTGVTSFCDDEDFVKLMNGGFICVPNFHRAEQRTLEEIGVSAGCQNAILAAAKESEICKTYISLDSLFLDHNLWPPFTLLCCTDFWKWRWQTHHPYSYHSNFTLAFDRQKPSHISRQSCLWIVLITCSAGMGLDL